MLPIGPGTGTGHFLDALGGSYGGQAVVGHAGVQRCIPAGRETKFTDPLGVDPRVQRQHYPVGSIDTQGRPVEPTVFRAGRIAHQHQANRPAGSACPAPAPRPRRPGGTGLLHPPPSGGKGGRPNSFFRGPRTRIFSQPLQPGPHIHCCRLGETGLSGLRPSDCFPGPVAPGEGGLLRKNGVV